jgi:predicted MPP superfamily phosphohydrolase
MIIRHLTFFLACFLLPTLAHAQPATQPSLTFIAWSDQHILYNGDASHLAPAIDAINHFKPKPAFVLGCGDCTDWPTPAAVKAWNTTCGQVRYPIHTVLGNHDEGQDPSDPRRLDRMILPISATLIASALVYLLLCFTKLHRRNRVLLSLLPILPGLFFIHRARTIDDGMKDWLVAREAGLSYTFDRSGIHFVCLFTPYTSPETIGPQALAFIREDLAKIPKSEPVILATHYCFESIHNRDQLIDALAGSNTILILGGHHHTISINHYRNRDFLQIPSPRYTPFVTEIQITPTRLLARNYNFKTHQFSPIPAHTLDLSLRLGANEPSGGTAVP